MMWLRLSFDCGALFNLPGVNKGRRLGVLGSPPRHRQANGGQFADLAPDPCRCYNIRMNTQLKITKIGNSAGVILPKDLLAHLDSAVGETLSVTKTPRGIELSSSEPDFDAQMAAARGVMAHRKRALRELAK